MDNKKGQSLVDVIFSIGIIVLVLTGVVVLVVSTAKVKRMALERQRAVELSQTLIEKKILEIKTNYSFWDTAGSLNLTKESNNPSDFPNYVYDVEYKSCSNQSCNIVFTVRWGDGQNLSVERLFSRQGI